MSNISKVVTVTLSLTPEEYEALWIKAKEIRDTLYKTGGMPTTLLVEFSDHSSNGTRIQLCVDTVRYGESAVQYRREKILGEEKVAPSAVPTVPKKEDSVNDLFKAVAEEQAKKAKEKAKAVGCACQYIGPGGSRLVVCESCRTPEFGSQCMTCGCPVVGCTLCGRCSGLGKLPAGKDETEAGLQAVKDRIKVKNEVLAEEAEAAKGKPPESELDKVFNEKVAAAIKECRCMGSGGWYDPLDPAKPSGAVKWVVCPCIGEKLTGKLPPVTANYTVDKNQKCGGVDCLGCQGRGGWYSPDNGQWVTCLGVSDLRKPTCLNCGGKTGWYHPNSDQWIVCSCTPLPFDVVKPVNPPCWKCNDTKKLYSSMVGWVPCDCTKQPTAACSKCQGNKGWQEPDNSGILRWVICPCQLKPVVPAEPDPVMKETYSKTKIHNVDPNCSQCQGWGGWTHPQRGVWVNCECTKRQRVTKPSDEEDEDIRDMMREAHSAAITDKKPPTPVTKFMRPVVKYVVLQCIPGTDDTRASFLRNAGLFISEEEAAGAVESYLSHTPVVPGIYFHIKKVYTQEPLA